MQSDTEQIEIRDVRNLSLEQLREATAMLADAFDTEPLPRAAFSNPAGRAKALRALFTVMLEDGMRFGRVHFAYNPALVGALVWYPPGAYPLPPSRHIRLMTQYLRMAAADILGCIKFLRALAVLNRVRPKQPHCYCCCLAVAFSYQGRRVGPKLVAHFLHEVDRLRLPSYWETQKESSVFWYRRLGGYVLHEGLELFHGGPRTWTVWREAQQANAAP